MEKTEVQKRTGISTDWRDHYRLPPRGIGHLEPGMVDAASSEMLAFRIAKALYQTRPDVFNLGWLTKETGLTKNDLITRIRSLYDRRLLMLAAIPAVQVFGQGLYYWFARFRPGTLRGVKDAAAASYQHNGAIWNGLETVGAFDSVLGACPPTLDQLIWEILVPVARNDQSEWIRVCPVSRALRSEHMNLWDAPEGRYRVYEWGLEEPKALLNVQRQMDEADIRLVLALNRMRPPQDYFDFRVLAEVSGLDAAVLQRGIECMMQEARQLVPVVYLNWQKMGLTQTILAVRLRRNVPVDCRSRLADDLAAIPEFHTVWQFADAHYDLGLIACTQTTDIAALRRTIKEFDEVDLIDEAEAHRQYRCFGCSLDDASNMWEQCIAFDGALKEARA